MSDREDKYTVFGNIDRPHEGQRLVWINSVDLLPTEEERSNYTIMWQGARPSGLVDAYGSKWCKVARR